MLDLALADYVSLKPCKHMERLFNLGAIRSGLQMPLNYLDPQRNPGDCEGHGGTDDRTDNPVAA